MFATLIREYRKGLKISQESMAERLGISANHLSRIEREKVYPSGELIHIIIDVISKDPRLLDIQPKNTDIHGMMLLLYIKRFDDIDKNIIFHSMQKNIRIILETSRYNKD